MFLSEDLRNENKRWLVKLVILSLSCVSALPAPAIANENEWILEQVYSDAAKVRLFVSRDAVKIVNLQWEYQLIAKAPSWTVHCFRPSAKTEWIGELNQFSGCMLNNPFAYATKPETSLKSFGSVALNGLKCTRYAYSRASQSTIFGADDIEVSPQAAEFVCRFYNFANPSKIPVYKHYDQGHGQTLTRKGEWFNMNLATDLRSGLVVELTTKSWKKVPFKASDFDYPRGYKRLSVINQVAYSGKQKETVKQVLDSFGFTSEPKAERKGLPDKSNLPNSH